MRPRQNSTARMTTRAMETKRRVEVRTATKITANYSTTYTLSVTLIYNYVFADKHRMAASTLYNLICASMLTVITNIMPMHIGMLL